MSMTYGAPSYPHLRHDINMLRRNWLWFVLLGVAMIVLGFLALGSVMIASLATAMAIGALIFVSGIAETVGSFWSRGWSGFFLHLLSGLLSMVVGFLILQAPVGGLLALTMLLACLLIVGGVFKMAAAATYRFATWGWPFVGGALDLILGILIWLQWPASALWVIGMFIGISFLFRGINWLALGFSLRAVSPETES